MQNSQNSFIISVTCEVRETLALADVRDLQGGLKTRSDEDYELIISSIRKYGIAFPFFVWQNGDINYVLDGHGRAEALRRAEAGGAIIPPLPVVYIEADDERQALNLLLRLNSRYGAITLDGLRDFIEGADIDLNEVRLPELPDLENQLAAMLNDALGDTEAAGRDKPEFILLCPECGEVYEITDDELREVIGLHD